MKGQHNNPDNIWKFIKIPEDPDACWIWIGCLINGGYGRLGFNNKRYLAHRFVFEYLMGEQIPKELVSDHLCRNRACVNPEHLEFVTDKVNTNRGIRYNSSKTECIHGHKFTKKNTLNMIQYGRNVRHCKKCQSIRYKKYYQKQKEMLINV